MKSIRHSKDALGMCNPGQKSLVLGELTFAGSREGTI
jgi:hypothetical protein